MSETIRLLYAEDSAADRDLTRAYFQAHAPDFALEMVGTGQECLARLREGRHDGLLLDNHLPDCDGADVLRALTEADLSLPVVMTTAVGDEELVVRLLRLGAWDYVPKQGDYIQSLPSVLRSAVAEHRRLREQGHAARRRQRRVLYVEHNAADIDLTSQHFAAYAGHLSLEVVATSKEALERLKDEPAIDLVLADLRMPDMNALDLLREVRQRGLSLPVVVVTGQGDEMTAVAALKLGAYDYIVKRADYLMQLPYAIDNAIDRFQLTLLNRRLHTELAERQRSEAERAQLVEDLRQAQKIDSLGRLAGGVAHDFNNLLTVIIGRTDLLLLDTRDGDPVRESLADIQAAATRAAELTRQLLAFSRRQLLQPRVIDLNALIHDGSRMLRRLLGEDVELVTVLAGDLGRVRADPGQIDQVIINLAVNARDAMPRGGTLTIETRNLEIGPEDPQPHPSFVPGSYVMVAMSNSGESIDAAVLPRIFEPFFTTKARGGGTGLGLSMVYGIVKQSGGWIRVDSEPARGTTFEIYLPRVNAPISAAAEGLADAETPRGSEAVLVVEDEETVRKLTCQTLRGYGYQVIEASDGGDALLKCEQHSSPIPLMITDVVMPQMSGPELAHRLRQLYPGMKVIFTSGYTDDAMVRHGLREHTMSFLQKPFAPAALARKVREVLDDRTGATV